MEDGLNIYEIIRDLISNKFKIIFITILFTALGYYYNNQRITKVNVSFPFYSISDTEISKLEEINKLNLYEYKDDLGHVKKFITKDKLLKGFIKEFNNFTVVKNTIESQNNIDEESLISEVKKYKIIENKIDENKINYHVKISTNNNKYEDDIFTLTKIIEAINHKVKDNIIKEINFLTKAIETSTSIKIDEKQGIIDYKIAEHNLNMEEQLRQYKYLLYLKENFKEAEIYDELKNLYSNILQNTPNADTSGVYSPLYLFNVIDVCDESSGSNCTSFEKEEVFNLITNYMNSNTKNLPKGIKLLDLELKKLKELNYSKKVQNVVSKSALYNENFRVIDYDIYSIGYKFKKGILEDVYIFSLAGFFLSSMFVLLYAGYKRHFVY